MKYRIRQGMYETNSSASHAIIKVTEDTGLDYDPSTKTLRLGYDGSNTDFNEYRKAVLTSMRDKLNYYVALLICHMRSVYDDTDTEDIVEEIIEPVKAALEGVCEVDSIDFHLGDGFKINHQVRWEYMEIKYEKSVDWRDIVQNPRVYITLGWDDERVPKSLDLNYDVILDM